MKVFGEINNITAHYFPLEGNDIIVSTFSNEIKRIGAKSWEHSFTGVKYPKLVYGDNLFVQQREEGALKEGTGCINLKTGEQKELSFLQSSILLTSLLQETKVLTRYKDQNRKKKIQLIDLHLLNSDWEIDTDLQLVWGFDKGILGHLRGKSEIVFADIRDGRVIWHFDLFKLNSYHDFNKNEQYILISKILGIFDNNIYLYLDNGKILLLDIKTGLEVFIIENDKNTDQGSFNGQFMHAVELDQENGKLIQLFNQRYTEVDLKTHIVTQETIEDMIALGIQNLSRFVFDKEYIYFSDEDSRIIAAYNRNTKKIDWKFSLSQEGINKEERPRYARTLKLHENRLYALDNKNTLHVFEKENTNIDI